MKKSVPPPNLIGFCADLLSLMQRSNVDCDLKSELVSAEELAFSMYMGSKNGANHPLGRSLEEFDYTCRSPGSDWAQCLYGELLLSLLCAAEKWEFDLELVTQTDASVTTYLLPDASVTTYLLLSEKRR